jgi:hypothetical protein
MVTSWNQLCFTTDYGVRTEPLAGRLDNGKLRPGWLRFRRRSKGEGPARGTDILRSFHRRRLELRTQPYLT